MGMDHQDPHAQPLPWPLPYQGSCMVFPRLPCTHSGQTAGAHRHWWSYTCPWEPRYSMPCQVHGPQPQGPTFMPSFLVFVSFLLSFFLNHWFSLSPRPHPQGKWSSHKHAVYLQAEGVASRWYIAVTSACACLPQDMESQLSTVCDASSNYWAVLADWLNEWSSILSLHSTVLTYKKWNLWWLILPDSFHYQGIVLTYS